MRRLVYRAGFTPKVGVNRHEGEAVSMTAGREPEVSGNALNLSKRKVTGQEPCDLQWYALYTHSHCEQSVAEQLTAKGFRIFLPKIETWSRRAGKQHLISLPMFPGYLFLHHAMDKVSYIDVRNARGLVRILGGQWDRLQTIPAGEIEAVQKALNARVPILPHPYLSSGQRVRIAHGPLAGAEGVLVQSNPMKGLLVLSVDLLQRSIAVEVECSAITVA
jgi:transcription termination/antitermination protein NusG